MNQLPVILVLFLVSGIKNSPIKPKGLHPDAGLDIFGLAAKYGYPIESHQVTTDDGYILTMHRILHGVNNTNKETGHPVLLMHGLLSSSVDWINMGPGSALGLLLADEGYDVWLGNQRGNTWSRKHLNIDADKNPEKFFNFSFHHIGFYDIPAKIDYILNETKKPDVVYVGHSQGTTDLFIMAAEKPEYNAKVRLGVALAPIAYMGHLPNPFVRLAADHLDLIYRLVEIFKVNEFLPYYDFIGPLGDLLCSDADEFQDICVFFVNLICGFDSELDPVTKFNFVPVITSNAPAGSDIKQILHFLQEIESGQFRQYDYGSEENNTIQYGQSTPPVYDVTKITAPISLYYAGNDWLASVEDVQRLADELPNLANFTKISLETFNHLDFIWARHVADLVYKDVIAEIKTRT